MNAKEFVELFYTEKNNMLKSYFISPIETEVGLEIDNLGLTTEQMVKMQNIIDTVLTDAMYTILLGLDGESSIGSIQQVYEIYDKNGCKISNFGEIEEYAYEYFHENK